MVPRSSSFSCSKRIKGAIFWLVCILYVALDWNDLFGLKNGGSEFMATTSSGNTNGGNTASSHGRIRDKKWGDIYENTSYFRLYSEQPVDFITYYKGLVYWQGVYMLPYCNALQTRYVESPKEESMATSGKNRWLPSSSVQVDKQTISAYTRSKSSSLEKMAAVKALLRQYVLDHNVNTFNQGPSPSGSANVEKYQKAQDRALCRSNRAFVLGVYSCPQQLGNRMNEFLNAFATAVVTNRTLLWKFCDRSGCSNKPEDCSSYLNLASLVERGIPARSKSIIQSQSWIPNAASTIERLHNGGCGYPSYQWNQEVESSGPVQSVWRYEKTQQSLLRSSFDQTDRDRDFLNGVTPHQLVPHELYSTAGEAMVACCGIDTLSRERILDVGSLERWELFGLSFPGANLGTHAYTRAGILFGGGASLAYGELLRQAFSFGASVLQWNNGIKLDARLELPRATFSRRRRRLVKNDDDDSPLDRSQSKQKSSTRYVRKAGRQELPPEALALHAVGKTTVRSPQGTSVGPRAGGNDVIIADAGGESSSQAALKAGAAPPDELKSAASPEVQPLVARPKQKKSHKVGHQVADRWNYPHAGNHTSRTEASYVGVNAQSGNRVSANGLAATKNIDPAVHDLSVETSAEPIYVKGGHSRSVKRLAGLKPVDTLLSKLYGGTDTNKIDKAGKTEGIASNLNIANVTDVNVDGAPILSVDQRDGFILAVHVRHMSQSDTGENDRRGELACITSMLEMHVPQFSASTMNLERKFVCTVILASDREATLLRLAQNIESLGCHVVYAVRPPTTTKSNQNAPFGVGNEHGPYRDGILPVADLELLSHADAFVGSADDNYMSTSAQSIKPSHLSTYSLLAASLIATNERNKLRVLNSPNYNILSHESDFVRWLPHCGNSFGSYRVGSNHIPSVEPMLPAYTKTSNKDFVPAPRSFDKGSGNGHYEPTDCPFFTWNRQCVDQKISRGSVICRR